MSFDLEQLNLIVNYDDRVSVIQKLIEDGQFHKEIQTYLYQQFISNESRESWIGYCINLWVWACEQGHFQDSSLSTEQFLIILKRTSDFSQRRVLWDLQLSVLKPGDYVACEYLKKMVSQVQGIERSYLRKVLSELEKGLTEYSEPQWNAELLNLTLEKYDHLEREQKLYYLKQISEGNIPLPNFSEAILNKERDSFVISSLVKVFPPLFYSKLGKKGPEIVQSFIPFANHQDSRVRANCLEGLCELFQSAKKEPEFYGFLLNFSQDPDSRVKANALKGMGLFSKTESQEVIEAALGSTQSLEELDSLLWTLQELGIAHDFETVIQRSKTRLGDRRKVSKQPRSSDRRKRKASGPVIPMSDKEEA